MSRRVPLNSPEGRRLVERGPAWREHPDYYAPDGPPEEIPWHTEAGVKRAADGMKAWAERQAASLGVASLWDITDDEWLALARVCLGVKPR